MSKIPTQYLFEGNVITDIENVTGGYIWTDEGRIFITEECTFTVIYKNLRFGVEAHHVDDGHDMYSVSVYDQTKESDRYRRENIFDNPNNSNEICQCYLDSTGGGVYDEEISIIDCNGTRYEKVENAIMGTLFGREDLGIEGLIKPF